jgi:hypothetical protein
MLMVYLQPAPHLLLKVAMRFALVIKLFVLVPDNNLLAQVTVHHKDVQMVNQLVSALIILEIHLRLMEHVNG